MSGRSAVALAYLVVVAVVALPAYNWLLSVTSPALVGTYAFVNPVVAVLLGWAVAGEVVTGRTGPAAALVVLGVTLLVWPRKRAAAGGVKGAGAKATRGGDGGIGRE